jgi:DNA-directed RNA polymerase specialized sigma24 family protein
MTDPKDELEAAYRADGERLVGELGRLFPSLQLAECEDLVQMAFIHALQELAKPGFVLQHRWHAWLSKVAQYRAIDYLRKREEWSLDALLRAEGSGGDSDGPGLQPPDPGLTPSQVLQQAERAEGRRVLVSDILAAYVQHVERYGMHVQREVLERSLRGQDPSDAARDMGRPRQQVYDHRSRAFEWIRAEVQRRDPHGSILATVFGNRPTTTESETPAVPPRRLHDLIHLAVDELGALCPSDTRWAQFRAAPDSPEMSDIRYHLYSARWYLDARAQAPGCRLCAARESAIDSLT